MITRKNVIALEIVLTLTATLFVLPPGLPQVSLGESRDAFYLANLPADRSLSFKRWENFRQQGDVACRNGDFAQADELYKQALVEALELGPDSFQTIETLKVLGRLQMRRNKFSEAGQYYQHSLQIIEHKLGSDSQFLDPVLDDLAQMESKLSNLAEAEVHLKRLLAVRLVVLTPDNQIVVDAITQLISVEIVMQHWQEVEHYVRMVLPFYAGGQLGPVYAQYAYRLAEACENQGKVADAEVAWKTLFDLRRRVKDAHDPWLLKAEAGLARVYQRENKPDQVREMKALLSAAEPVAAERVAPDHVATDGVATSKAASRAKVTPAAIEQDPAVIRLSTRAGEEFRAGHLDQAINLYAKEVSVIQGRGAGETDQMALALYYLANCLYSHGKYSDAERLVKRAIDLNHKLKIASSESTIFLELLAHIYRFSRQYPEAELAYRQALDSERKYPRGNPLYEGLLLECIGASLDGQGKFNEAETFYRKALTAEESIPAKSADKLRLTMTYAAVLARSGKKDEAVALLMKAQQSNPAERNLSERIRQLKRNQ